MVGLPLVALALIALTLTIVHARQARSFERGAAQTTGRIVAASSDEAVWIQHVTVELTVAGRRVEGRAPVFDPGVYHIGQEVDVLYDPSRPERIMLAEERYNAETPVFFWSAVLVGGLLPGLMGWWWVRRLRRLVAHGGPTFAMVATIGDERRQRWSRRRRWVTLLALDVPTAEGEGRPVGSYPLMAEVGARSGTGQPAEVKGNVRDGGLVVARLGDVIAWPAGRLRR